MFNVLHPCPKFLDEVKLFEVMGLLSYDDGRVWNGCNITFYAIYDYTDLTQVCGYIHDCKDATISEDEAIKQLRKLCLGESK